jgi:hypothetical protein
MEKLTKTRMHEIADLIKDDKKFITEKIREGKRHELTERFDMGEHGFKRKR